MRTRGFRFYVLVLAAVGILGGCGGAVIRLNTFGCYANRSGDDNFIADCATRRYGDFEHGVYALGLRPGAMSSLKRASVLFLGNSRLQAAFSSEEVSSHFERRSQLYYLLGFGHAEESGFAEYLIRRHSLRPRVVIVNADPFFTGNLSPVAAELVFSPGASERSYRLKSIWQSAHRIVCGYLGTGTRTVCNRNPTVFRRDRDGGWVLAGFDMSRQIDTVSPSGKPADEERLAVYLDNAAKLVSALVVPRSCVILTEIPSSEHPVGLAKRIAEVLGAQAVIPVVEGMKTFDRSHLTPESAKRWSQEFLKAAGPLIDECHKS